MINTKIIVPTHSNYLDVVKNFLEILEIKWKNHPEIIISITGENKKIEGYFNYYNGSCSSLIDCIVNASALFEKINFYYCFLGDAFITNEVSNNILDTVLNSLDKNKINYCSLLYFSAKNNIKNIDNCIRFIHSKDRYNVNFVSFIASKEFIQNELSAYKSDLDFEIFYLNKANLENKYYDDKAILVNDVFKIIPAINKGKWEKRKLRKLKMLFPNIQFSSRDNMSLKEELLANVMIFMRDHIPNRTRILLKKTLKKIGYNFTTDL